MVFQTASFLIDFIDCLTVYTLSAILLVSTIVFMHSNYILPEIILAKVATQKSRAHTCIILYVFLFYID